MRSCANARSVTRGELNRSNTSEATPTKTIVGQSISSTKKFSSNLDCANMANQWVSKAPIFFSYNVSWYKYIHLSAKRCKWRKIFRCSHQMSEVVCGKTYWKLQAKFSINKCILIAARRTSDFVVQNYLGFLFALPQNSIVHEERYLRCLRKLHISVLNFTCTLEALQTLGPSR